MGVFDFVSEAGKKLFGGGRISESAILDHLSGLGVRVHGLSVVAYPDDGKVTVTGRVGSQADREKLILAAGNVEGVKQVDDRLHVASLDAPAEPPTPEPPAPTEASAPDPAPTPDGDPAPEATPEGGDDTVESVFYTVQSGDTLSGIAKAHYGNAGLYMKIFEANQPMLSDPNKIYPGQVLRIPPND